MSEPLILLPGMMCDARLYGPQITALSGHAPRVLSLDAETTAEMAEAVLAAAPQRFALAGLSMGGIVAMEVMAMAPARVTRLALMDTNPKAESTEVAAARAPQMARVEAGHLAAVMREEMKPNYLADGPNRAAILDLVLEMAMACGPGAFLRQSRALMTRPVRQDTLRTVTVPTLILCGAEDRLCPPHRHTLMAELIPHATLRIVPKAGHLPTLEQPVETNAALLDWLAA